MRWSRYFELALRWVYAIAAIAGGVSAWLLRALRRPSGTFDSRVGDGDVKRRVPAAGGSDPNGPKHLAPLESTVFGKLFNIVTHCAVTRYEDGEPRRTGWITIKTQGSAWCVQVKDPDGCVSFSATADTLDNALALADLLLGSDEAPWEKDAFLAKQKK